jgi:hypothetical protein
LRLTIVLFTALPNTAHYFTARFGNPGEGLFRGYSASGLPSLNYFFLLP